MKKTTAILMGAAFLFTTNTFAAELLTKNEFEKVESQYEKSVRLALPMKSR